MNLRRFFSALSCLTDAGLPKAHGCSRNGADGQALDLARFEMRDIVLVLNHAGYDNKAFVQNSHAMLVIEVRADNYSRRSGLVLQGHEDDSLGSSRPLMCNDAAGDHGFFPARTERNEP